MRGSRSRLLVTTAAFSALSALYHAPTARAANGTWANTGATSGAWVNTDNWVGGIVPGSSTAGSTASTDVALFNTSVGTYGTSASPITLPSAINLQSIAFDNAAGAYTIGTNAGPAFNLSAGGSIQINPTFTSTSTIESIAAPISLAGGPGTYTLVNNSATGTGSLSIYSIAGAASTTLVLDGSNTNNNNISALISGGTFINKTGAGTWTLGDGVNSYTGGTQISGGTLIIATSGNLDSIGNGTGTLTLAGGTLTNTYGTGNISNPVIVAAGTTSLVNANTSGNIQITGSITGSGILQNNTSTSASTLIMGDISGFTGSFNYVDNGASAQNMYFASSGSVANASLGSLATFNLSGSTTAGRQLTVGNSNVYQMGALNGSGGILAISGTLQVGYLNNSTGFAGVITGGSLTKVGTGTLTLSNTDTYTGLTTVNGGTLQFLNVAIPNGGVSIGSSGTLALNNSAGSTVSNSIGGNGTLSINGAGTTVLSSTNNTFYGTLNIAAGNTLQLGNNLALKNTPITVPTWSVGAGTLDLSLLTDPVFGGLSGTGNYTVPAAYSQFSLSPTAGVSYTLNGNVSGSSLATLVMNGAGTQIISGNALNTGATNIYSGTLEFANDNSIGGSGASVSVYPAGVFASASAVDQAFLGRIANPTTSYGVVALGANDSQNLNFNSSSLTNASLGAVGTQTYSGTLTPNGTTYRLGGGGGTLIVSGALTGASNTLQINPNVASNTVVSLTNTTNTLGGAVTVNAGTLLLDYTGTNTGATILNNNALSMGGATLSVLGTNTSGQNTTQSFASLALTAGANSIVTTAAGSGSSTLNLGTITRSVGATVDFTLPASGSINVKNASVKGILGGYATVGGTTWAVSAGNGTTAGAITGLPAGSYTTTATAGTTSSNYSNANIDVTTSQNTSAGVITPNSLRFNTAAATTLTMNAGTNTLASGGILVTANVGNNLSTITGGTLNFNGSAGGGDVIITNNDTQSQLTISSLINTKVTKAGPGTVVLTGGSYGPYYGDGGVLNIASNGTLAYSSAIANNGGTIIIGALDNEQYVNLQPNSGGTILENSTTFANTFTFNGGTIGGTGYFNDQAVGGSGWTAVAGTNSVLSTSTVYLNTIVPINLNAGSVLTVSSTLLNSGLNIFGSGTMILTGKNTFTNMITIGGTAVVQANSADTGTSGPLGNGGQINLSGGTLQWGPGSNSYDYSSRFNTAAGKTYSFDTNGENINFATALISSGAPLTKLGAGTLTLNGANTLSGATSIKAGTLALGATGTLPNTTGVSVASGANFNISAATTPFTLSSAAATLGGSGTVIGNYNHTTGILTPGGTGTVGTLTFANNLTLAGGTVNLDLNGTNTTAGGTVNDLLVVGGNLNLSSPTAVTTTFIGGTPTTGTYDIINVTGSVIGSLSNLLPPGRGNTFSVVPGTGGNPTQVDLNFTNNGATLYWNGSNGLWDVQTTSNWYNPALLHNDQFYSNDNVNFNDASGVSTSINLTTSLSPGSITVTSNSNNYVFGGSGSLIGGGGLTMSGTSTLTMNTSNSYTGSTNAAGGVIVVNAATGLGNGALTVGTAGTIQVTSSGTLGNSSVTVNGTATVNNSAANGLGTGALTIGPSGHVTVGSGGTTGSLNNSSYLVNGSLTYNLSSGAALTTPFNGSGSISFTGGSSYNLGGNSSSYNGSINILSGNLYPGGVTYPLGTGTVNVSGGQIYATSGLTITNPLILGTSGTSIEVGGNHTGTFSGPVTVTANTSLFVDGGSTLVLNGAVTGNNFNVSTAGATGNALTLGGSWNLGTGTLTTGDQINITAPTGQTITMSSNIASTNSLVLNGPGTTALLGTNTFGGNLYLQNGLLQVSQISDSGASNIGHTGNIYLYGPATLEITAGSNHTNRSVYVLGSGAANIQVDSGASLSFNGNFQYFGSGTNSFNVSGGGSFSLFGSYAGPWNTLNSVTGSGTTVTLGAPVNQINDIGAGATVKFLALGQVTYSGGTGVGLNSGGTLDLNGFGQSISALRSTNAAASVTNNGGSDAILTVGNTTNNLSGTYAGIISDGGSAVGLTTGGTGTLTLSGSSTYSGPTEISAGKLLAGSATALSPNSGFTIDAGATLDTSGYANTINSLSIAHTATLNLGSGKILTVTGSANLDGTLNLSGTPASLPETLMTYSSESGMFANFTPPAGDMLSYGLTSLQLISSGPSGPSSLTWNNTGGSGNGTTWDTSNANWNNGTGPVAYSDTSNTSSGDIVTFGNITSGTSSYNVTVSGTVNPTSTTFTNTLGNNYNISGGNISGPGSLTLTGGGTVTLSGSNSYAGGTNVSSGKLVLTSSNAFPSGVSNAGTGLIVGSGAVLQIANHGVGATVVPFVSSLTNNGTIDITNNAMVLKGASASIGTISGEIAVGYSGGAWNANSDSSHLTSLAVITSSTAEFDTTHLTAVGVATGLTSFEGATVSASDVLIKYTYYGDANLNGSVNSADYALIDAGFLSRGGMTGWQNGDFNYDGVINGSDYTLIDNAFNTQGAQLSAQIASATAQVAGGGSTSAVPEPASLGLIGLGALGLLGRRSRRAR